MTKIDVIEGLQKRIDWLVANDRPSSEIAKTVELVITTAQDIFDEEQSALFYERLAEQLGEA